MSSYSVNGYNITLTTNTQTGDTGEILVFKNADLILEAEDGENKSRATFFVSGYYLRDLRIHLPVIKVLDPAVMQAVLSLYEKSEVAQLGGVSFPMSLRLNSLGYRFSAFPLGNNGQTDFYFRIAGTDRSVRALKWIIYDRTQQAPYGLIGTNTGAASAAAYNGDSEKRSIKVVRLETRIGSEEVHPVVEDLSINTSNVDNFVSVNDRHSGHLFSSVPYYRESSRMAGYICDDIHPYSNASNVFDVSQSRNEDNVNTWKFRNSFIEKAVSWGCVSLENLDRREGDHSGSYSASGKDLTNVGGIEMRMRIGYFASAAAVPSGDIANEGAIPTPIPYPDATGANTWTLTGADTGNFEIVFMYAYDAVHEVSPQGVMDITNAVL
jgi:hypothetical protein